MIFIYVNIGVWIYFGVMLMNDDVVWDYVLIIGFFDIKVLVFGVVFVMG